MENKKDDTNWGCLIIVAIFVLINIFVLFSPENKENISGVGGMIIFIAFLAGIIYFISKSSSNSSEIETKEKAISVNDTPINKIEENTNQKANSESNNKGFGCIIGIVGAIIALVVLGSIINNSDITYFVGTIFAIVLVIGFGIYMYNSGKD